MAPAAERRTVVLVVARSEVADELRLLLDDESVEVLPGGDCTKAPDGQAPDVVVVDLALAPLPPECRAPMLAVVRRDRPDDLGSALEAGVLDVLARPFVVGEVRARVAATARLGRAEARLDEMEAWSHRAAHDLATPLAVISMVAETLHDSWERLKDADRQRLLSSMRNQAGRTRGMLDEAIAVARGEPALPAGEAKEAKPLSGQPPRP